MPHAPIACFKSMPIQGKERGGVQAGLASRQCSGCLQSKMHQGRDHKTRICGEKKAGKASWFSH